MEEEAELKPSPRWGTQLGDYAARRGPNWLQEEDGMYFVACKLLAGEHVKRHARCSGVIPYEHITLSGFGECKARKPSSHTLGR